MVKVRRTRQGGGERVEVSIGDSDPMVIDLTPTDLAEIRESGQSVRAYARARFMKDFRFRAATAGRDVLQAAERGVVPVALRIPITALVIAITVSALAFSFGRLTGNPRLPTNERSQLSIDKIIDDGVALPADELAAFFDEARERHISRAVPKAVLYAARAKHAQDGRLRPHQIAAKRLLDAFTSDERLSACREHAETVNWTAEKLIDRLQEVYAP